MGHFLNMNEELEEEEKFYNEEPTEKHISNIKNAGELLIEHAYDHLHYPADGIEDIVIDSKYDRVLMSQFYLNLAIGLELFLKSEFLKRGFQIQKKKGKDKIYTKSLRELIHMLEKILDVEKDDLEEIKLTLDLIRIRRDNIAHSSHKSFSSYANFHRISYVVLVIYEKLGGNNKELIEKLKRGIKDYEVKSGMDYKPLKYIPK